VCAKTAYLFYLRKTFSQSVLIRLFVFFLKVRPLEIGEQNSAVHIAFLTQTPSVHSWPNGVRGARTARRVSGSMPAGDSQTGVSPDPSQEHSYFSTDAVRLCLPISATIPASVEILRSETMAKMYRSDDILT
jgi:hypothetical protein